MNSDDGHLPNYKYPSHIIDERLNFLTQPDISLFNDGFIETLDMAMPNKENRSTRKTTTNGAANFGLPTLSKATEEAVTKLRDDLILFDDVWYSDIFSDENKLYLPKYTKCVCRGACVLLLYIIRQRSAEV